MRKITGNFEDFYRKFREFYRAKCGFLYKNPYFLHGNTGVSTEELGYLGKGSGRGFRKSRGGFWGERPAALVVCGRDNRSFNFLRSIVCFCFGSSISSNANVYFARGKKAAGSMDGFVFHIYALC